MSEENFNFEKAFGRLEEILERMNSGNVSLDESLKLYEEADKLIVGSTNKLQGAEAKIEMLIKKRSGAIEVDASGNPMKEELKIKD
jgi:exodeoxyribonuclease VII small subunit